MEKTTDSQQWPCKDQTCEVTEMSHWLSSFFKVNLKVPPGRAGAEIIWEVSKKYAEIDKCRVPHNKEQIVCVPTFLELAVSWLCREPRKRYNYGGNVCLIYENQAQKSFCEMIEYYCLSSLIKKTASSAA